MNNIFESLNKYYEKLQLDEMIYNGPDNPSTESVFNFFSELSHLLNSLDITIVYNKANSFDDQYDNYNRELDKESNNSKWGYTCFTREPTKVAIELKRPFGIEFNNNYIEKLKNAGNKQNDFNQFDIKTTNHSGDNNYPYNYNLKIGTVGKYKMAKTDADGNTSQYFFTLQGLYSPRVVSKNIYDDLVKLLYDSDFSGDQVVHLIFHDDPKKTDTFMLDKINHKLLTTAEYKNLTDEDKNNNNNFEEVVNNKYIFKDFIDEKTSNIKWEETKPKIVQLGKEKDAFIYEKDYVCSNNRFIISAPGDIAFNANIDDVEEIYAVVLNKDAGLDSVSSAAYSKNTLNKDTLPIYKDELNNEDLYGKDLYSALDKALNEYEFRIYSPVNNDLPFEKEDIKQIRLPNIYIIPGINGDKHTYYVQLKQIFDELDALTSPTLDNYFFICNKYNSNNKIESNLIIKLYKFIKSEGLTRKFYTYENKTSHIIKYKKLKDYDYDVDNPLEKVHSSEQERSLRRYIANDGAFDDLYSAKFLSFDSPDALQKIQSPDNTNLAVLLHDSDGHPTWVYKNFSPKGSSNSKLSSPARIGVEGLVFGKQENTGKVYLRLIQKSDAFSELPGGSFEETPDSLGKLKSIALNKVGAETGYNLTDSEFIDPNKIIYLQESPSDKYINKLTSDKGIPELKYLYSAYKLFIYILKNPIDPAFKSHDDSYPSRWFPIDILADSKNFLDRYSNLLQIIIEVSNYMEASNAISINATNGISKTKQRHIEKWIKDIEQRHSITGIYEVTTKEPPSIETLTAFYDKYPKGVLTYKYPEAEIKANRRIAKQKAYIRGKSLNAWELDPNKIEKSKKYFDSSIKDYSDPEIRMKSRENKLTKSELIYELKKIGYSKQSFIKEFINNSYDLSNLKYNIENINDKYDDTLSSIIKWINNTYKNDGIPKPKWKVADNLLEITKQLYEKKFGKLKPDNLKDTSLEKDKKSDSKKKEKNKEKDPVSDFFNFLDTYNSKEQDKKATKIKPEESEITIPDFNSITTNSENFNFINMNYIIDALKKVYGENNEEYNNFIKFLSSKKPKSLQAYIEKLFKWLDKAFKEYGFIYTSVEYGKFIFDALFGKNGVVKNERGRNEPYNYKLAYSREMSEQVLELMIKYYGHYNDTAQEKKEAIKILKRMHPDVKNITDFKTIILHK